MVAIVSGNSLGLSLASLATLGQRGTQGAAGQGRNGEQAFVNIANGNLVLQDFDDKLVGRGLDIQAVRTYNSQGLLNDDNADNWVVGAYGQRVQLTGTVATAGSTLTRTDRDGASAVYTWDVARSLYVSSAGAGAFDTIAYDSTALRFTWTDGSTGLLERYESTGQGRLLTASDPAGNTLTYAYNANGTLQSMVDANGETTYFDYTGTNLTQIRTVATGGASLTRVRYAYDSANRLSTVTVDLSPEDNSIADGPTYVTTYTYDGTSKRVASVTQKDGTSLAFTYVQVGADYRVATVKDGLGQTTSYTYDTTARSTTVTDPLGLVSVYSYDAAGQLTQIKAPPVGGVSQLTLFSYDASGNVTLVTDPQGFAVTMQYDANGNQTLQRDAAGNTITRTYDARNQLLTETVYLTPDPDGAGAGLPSQPLTTRYVYDAAGKNQVRFVLSPEGRVAEYRYDSYGQRTSSLEYAAAKYNVTALAATAVPTEAELVTWAGTQDRTQASRTDTVYDARGQIQKVTAFGRVDASGNGVADASQSITQYVYDRAGLLLSTISAIAGTTTFTYDGKGRQLSAQDALGQTTLSSYDDINNKTVITQANGLITTSVYDKNSRLVSVTQGSALNANLGVTTNYYDKNGRIYQQVDPTGARTGRLYDEAGRLVAEIDGNNRVTEYVYDRNNQLTQNIVYATAANAPAVTAYFTDPNSAPVNRLSAIRPASSAADQKSWRIYDSVGRLVRTIDAAGAVTDLRYDGASRLVGTTQYSQVIATASLGAAPTLAATAPTANAASDRVTRRFYDNDGLLLATLDAEGYLTESRYDAEGLLVTQISYATATTAALRASGTLAQLIPAGSAQDQTSRWIYDAQDRVVAQIDAEGFMTENVYDANGNITTSTRHAIRVDATLLSQMTTATTAASLRPAANAESRTTTVVYDKLNRVTQRTNHEGTVFRYEYDNAGNLVKTTNAFGTTEVQTINARYDIQGRLTGELTAEGGALLVAGQTQAQIDAIWSQYGLTHAYDAAGRRLSTTDAYGNKTLFFYDLNGRLTHSINALGEVTEQQYDTLGQLGATVRYGTRLGSMTGLAGGLVTEALKTAIDGIRNAALDSKQTFTYAVTGKLSSSTDELGNLTQSSYNAFGDLTGRTQALGGGVQRVQSMSVDRRGLVTGTVQDASGINAITSAIYDAFGRLTRSTDANGNVRQQGFDRLGRTVTTTDALLGVRTTSYDAFDRVLTQTDAMGQVTTFTYDKTLRSVAVKTPENITVTTVRTRLGQTQSVVDGNGNTTSYTYDKNGNLLVTTTALTTTTNTYDRSTRLATTKDANGTTTTLGYDAANRLLTRTVDPTGLNLITTYAYDAKGRQISVTDPNGVVTSIVYDLKGQVTSKAVDPTGLNLVTQYTYDGVGNTLTVIDPNGVTTQYAYDKLGRRTQMRVDPTGLNLTTAYAYDKNGNLTSSTDPNGQVTRRAYDAEDQLIFTLDALGNLQRTKYDAEGRVIQTVAYATPIDLTGLGAAPTVAQIEAKVVVSAAKDGVEYRVLDKNGRLAATVNGLGEVVKFTYDANGNVIDRVAYANRIALASWTPGTVPAPAADAARDQRLRSVYDQLNRAIYTIDGVGAVKRAVYDGNGNVVERISYAVTVPVATAATAAALTAAVTLATNPQQAGSNLFTQSEFANGVGDAPSRAGAVTATTMTGFAGAIRLASDPAGSYAYKSVSTTSGVTYTLSVIVEMEDGLPPSFGSASVNNVANSFALVLSGYGSNPVKYAIQDLGGGRYRVTATGVTPASPGLSFGVVKYATNDTRAFRVSGYQLEQANAASVYTPTTTAAVVYVASGTRERFVYDRANRLTWSADGVGAVTKQVYDKNGNVLKTIQYGTAISGSTVPSAVTASANDRITDRVYDRANRQIFVTDALGAMTETVYDKNGNVTTRYSFAKAVAVPTAASALTETQARAARVYDYAGADRVTRAAYDAANRQVFGVDATGAVTETSYDALGNAVRSVSYATLVNLTTLQNNWTASVSTVRALVTASATTDRVVKRAFDAAGRLVYSVDPMGFVKRNTYDGLDRITQTVDYSLSIPAATANTAAAIAAAIVVQAAQDRTNSFTYDAASRLVSTTDPLGFTESYAYDGLGQKVTFTNKKASVWTYVYDAAGRMTKETSPAVEVTTVIPDASGKLVVDATRTGSASIVTQMTYDALGNLKSRTEAVGRAEQRTTSYEYDAVGHQVRVIYPPVGVYNPAGDTLTTNGAGGLATRTELTKTLDTLTTYNVFGEAITNRDVAGSFSYKTYDLLGRVGYEVDALGFVTGYQYNTWGQVKELKRFGVGTTLTAGNPASLTAAQVSAAINAAGVNHGVDRTLTTTYDRAGRTAMVVESSAYTYDSSAALGAQYATAGRTTVNVYNAFGDLTRVGLLKNAGQNTWAYTNNYYNQKGQQVASVDALGYLTTQAFDGAGNVTVRTEFAKAVAAWNPASAPVAVPTTTADAANDRQTIFAFDRGGRKTSETRVSVEFSASTNGTSARANLVTSYAYDAVGNLTLTTDAAGGTTVSYYDALGRVRATASPSTSNGNLTAVTRFQRDAYGNVVVKTETHVYKATAGADALAAPGATSLTPGQSLAPGQSIYSPDGRYNFTLQTDGNLVVYDRHDNNQVLWNSQTGGSGANSFVFQADGNMVLSGPNGVVWNSGTAAKGGTSLVMQGDGNLVLYGASAALWTSGADNNSQINPDRLTYTQYDKLGHATQSTDAAGFNHYSSYDALGNVAKEWQLVTDGDNVSSTLFRAYQYDKLGQQTHVIDPASRSKVSGSTVSIVTQAQAGLIDTAMEYNAFGELTAKGVNGGRQEYFDYDNAGRIWRTNSGDGVDKVALYDLLGNQTAKITSYGLASGNADLRNIATPDAVAATDLRRTDMVYDLLGRVTSTLEPRRSEWTGGAQVSRLFSQGSVAGSSNPTRDENGMVNGRSGTNTVNLAWSPLRNLGSGDIKVVMEYMTQLYPLSPRPLDGNGNPVTTDESGNPLPPPQMEGGLIRTQTRIVTNAAENTNSLTMTWQDEWNDAKGGVEKVTRLTIYKKDVYGNWQPVISEGSLGYSGQVMDIDAPDDLTTTMRMQVRPAGSTGETGWVNAPLVNFGDMLRYNASGLAAGSYEYRVTQTTTAGVTSVTASGTVTLTSPPLSLISVPMAFYQMGATSGGLFTWSSPGTSVEQVFRYRVAGSTGAWTATPVTARGNGRDGVDVTLVAAGNYEYELLWTHSGEGVPYAHATGNFSSSGFKLPQWVPPVNLPVITGAAVRSTTTGGTDESGNPIGSPKTIVEWPYSTIINAGNTVTFEYRAVGGSAWSTLPIVNLAGSNESGLPIGMQQVDITNLAAGRYEYRILATLVSGGTSQPVAQATGILDNQRTPIMETRSGVNMVPYQVQVGSDPIYARDESGNIVYETVYETQYQTRTDPVYGWVQVPRQEAYTVAVQGPPQTTTDESGNVIIVRDPWGNIQYTTVYETRYRTVYDNVLVITGWQNVTYPVQVAVQKPVITGYQPRYETRYQAVPYSYQVQVGTTAPSVQDNTPPYTPGYMTPLIPPLFASVTSTVAGSAAVSQSNTNGANAVQTPAIQGAGSSPRPVVNRNTDRWGNVVSISDPRSAGWVTTYRYNANNQLIEQKQTDADGVQGTAGAAVTQLFYDKLGRQVAIKDANGKIQGQVYDARGNLLQELHADGGVIRNSYNVFGNKVSATDALTVAPNLTSFTYDSLGRLLTTTRGVVQVFNAETPNNIPQLVATRAIVESSTWDQAGRKLSQTNGNGETIRYVYDMQGRVVRTIQPMGQSTKVAYDALGNKTAEVDGNGYMATWSYSYFGKVLTHTDFGGRAYTYTYDKAGQLTFDSGTNRTYTYNIEGLLARTYDQTTGQDARYEYDLAGNRVREWFGQGGVVYKDNHIAYDALGRMRWVADGRAYVNIEYDKVGNRTRIKTHVLDQDTSLDSDLYFQYDAMNRQTVANAANAAGALGAQGHRITYDQNGNRTSDTWWGNRVQTVDGQSQITGYDPMTGAAIYSTATKQYVTSQGETTEAYRYDALGRLQSVVRDGVQTDARLYDGASRVVQTGPAGTLPVGYVNALLGTTWNGQTLAGTGSETRISTYNANGQITRQDVFNSQNVRKYTIGYGALGAPIVPGMGTAGGYDNAGNLLGYTVWNFTPGQVSVTNYANTYSRAEGYRQMTTVGTSNVNLPGGTNWFYGNGNELLGIGDVTLPATNRTFVSDMEGNILYSKYLASGQEQRQLVVNGEVLGQYGQLRDPNNPSMPNGVPLFQARAEFNFGYQPIDGNYPSASPGTYAVSVGDTLQSIARGAYGDEGLWYLIADANGLSSNADLKSGQVLTIPTKVGAANNANSFKPYDPSKMVGDTSPNMPMPEPKGSGGGCGGLGQIIVAIVAVVASYFTFGYSLSLIGPAGVTVGTASAGTLAAAGAIAGAVGSIASQAVGVAIGAQDSFSWKGVALGAIGGAIGGALSGFQPFGTASQTALVGNAIVRSAIGNAATQGIAIATGLQEKFSWKSVAASAASAGVGQGLNAAMDYYPGQQAGMNGVPDGAITGFDLGRSLVSGLGGSLVGQVARGGKISAGALAADAFGNVIGDSLAAANGQQAGEQQTKPNASMNTLHDGSTISDAEAIRRNRLFLQSAYAANGVLDPSQPVVMSEAPSGGRVTAVTTGVPPWAWERVDDGEGGTYYQGSYQSDSGAPGRLPAITVEARDTPPPGYIDTSFLTASRAAQQAGIDKAKAVETAPSGGRYYGSLTPYQPTFWEKTWLSPEVQHVMGNTIAGKLVGGVANTLGTGWASFVSDDGYNPATGKNLNLTQQRDGRIDTLINAAATVLTGGASTATRIEMQAVKSEALAIERQALTRGEQLRQKYGHLSTDERQAIIWERTENIARRELEARQAATPDAHFMARHSPQVPLRDQLVSAATGMRPDGKITGKLNNRFAVDSTQFLSNKDMLYGINRAERIQQYAISTGNPIDNYISLKFNDVVGEGYLKNTPLFGGDPTKFYRQTKFANFGIDSKTGQAITAFPVISNKSLGTLY
ncbi:YD repeat-containing protein [Variovorax boronicumulans]|uniref:LysM peptidoglycan-binding domain-containing protein n=1 Tax=Variovorax boronicumulans TaxID=436515 RepID=UPI00278128C5|nr:LysM peptidoglycan-binding domain-containing protein [Variovorax boronicumulans]MDQ0013780.1 YD repeat-containing protein [Variovorax boronicumulans]